MSEQETKYVVYRTMFYGQVDWLDQSDWDDLCMWEPSKKQQELSRGHSLTDAISLTMLVNKQLEIENEI